MPIYGDEKKREIARSVLPSTHRKGARDDLRHAKSRARSNVRHQLRLVNKGLTATDVIDNYDEASFDFEWYPDTEINEIKWERRNGDKLGALMRWAPTQVHDIRLRDRISKMYSIMPDNVIGRHAIGHLSYEDAFYVDDGPYRWYRYTKATPEEIAWERAVKYAVLYERLYSVFEKGLLNRFNKNKFKVRKRIYVPKARYDEAAERERRERAEWAELYPGAMGGGYSQRYRGYTNQYEKSGYRNYNYYYIDVKDRPLRGVHDIDNFIKDISSSLDINNFRYYPDYSRDKRGILERALDDIGV